MTLSVSILHFERVKLQRSELRDAETSAINMASFQLSLCNVRSTFSPQPSRNRRISLTDQKDVYFGLGGLC